MLTNNLFSNQCINFWWIILVFQRVFAYYNFLADKKKPDITMSPALNRKWSVSQQESSLPCASVINPVEGILARCASHLARAGWLIGPDTVPLDTTDLPAKLSHSESANRGKSAFVPWKFRPPLSPVLNSHIIKEIACVQPLKVH